VKKFIIFYLTLAVFLTSCSQGINDQTPTNQLPMDELNSQYPPPINNEYQEAYPLFNVTDIKTELDIHSPSEGFSALTGILNLKNNSILLTNTTVYLTLGKGDDFSLPPSILIGPSEEKGDYPSMTDSNAVFFIENIIPGTYYLVASSTNSYSIIEDINGHPIQIILLSNELLDLGDVYVTLP
jgi:hypothetical protein